MFGLVTVCPLVRASFGLNNLRCLSVSAVHCKILKDKSGVAVKTKKSKADVVLVAAKSIASNHQISVRKGRQSPDKVEFLAFDPEIQREVIYKEHHKIKSIREDFPGWYTEPSELKLPQDFKDDNDKKPKSE